MAETMMKMGSRLGLVSRSKASSSMANVPTLSRRSVFPSLWALELMKKILQTELKLTCHEDGAKHEKAEDHLKPDLQTSAFGNPRWPP